MFPPSLTSKPLQTPLPSGARGQGLVLVRRIVPTASTRSIDLQVGESAFCAEEIFDRIDVRVSRDISVAVGADRTACLNHPVCRLYQILDSSGMADQGCDAQAALIRGRCVLPKQRDTAAAPRVCQKNARLLWYVVQATRKEHGVICRFQGNPL